MTRCECGFFYFIVVSLLHNLPCFHFILAPAFFFVLSSTFHSATTEPHLSCVCIPMLVCVWRCVCGWIFASFCSAIIQKYKIMLQHENMKPNAHERFRKHLINRQCVENLVHFHGVCLGAMHCKSISQILLHYSYY